MRERPSRPLALLLPLLLLAVQARAQQAVSRYQQWEPEIRAFEAADRQSPPPRGAVLFTGSSSIRLWKSLAQDFPRVRTINRGFGGSEIEDALHFADRIILPYAPRLIVFYAGDNDLANGKTPERVLADYRRLVETVHERLPETRFAFLAIKPSLARWKLVDRIRAANELVRRYSAGDARLAYVDVFTPMLGADGTPRPELLAEDGLHMTPQGYALWREVLAPYLEPAAAAAPATGRRFAYTVPVLPDLYAQRTAQFREEPVVPGRVIFLGNSITQGGDWRRLLGDSTVLNRGIGGDVTDGVLQRLDDVTRRRPSKLFLLIGINDISRDVPDTVIAENVRSIVREVQAKSPETKIYLQSVLPLNPEVPRFPPHYDKREHVVAVNRLLRGVAASTGVHFVDLYPLFLDSRQRLDARYTGDGLHLNAEGYRVWVDHLRANGLP